MSDTPTEIRLPKLLLQTEAAELLRRSCGHVKRLRLEGKLAYLRRRPVVIDEKDLEIFVANAKMRRVNALEKSAGASPKPFALLTLLEAAVKFECTVRDIEYLCDRGHLPYLPGRTVLIDETDVPGRTSLEAMLRGQIIEKARQKQRNKALKREVARILAERSARMADGAFRPGGPKKKG